MQRIPGLEPFARESCSFLPERGHDGRRREQDELIRDLDRTDRIRLGWRAENGFVRGATFDRQPDGGR